MIGHLVVAALWVLSVVLAAKYGEREGWGAGFRAGWRKGLEKGREQGRHSISSTPWEEGGGRP